MVRLTEEEKESVRLHLGYVEGGPSSSRTVLEYRMNNLRNHQHRVFVQNDIAECNYCLRTMRLDAQGSGVTSSTITTGDLDRSTTNQNAESMKRRQKAYFESCSILAQHLGVELLLGQGYQWQYTLEEIKTPPPPGPADTINESKMRSHRRYI